VKAETGEFVAYARKMLGDAAIVLDAGLTDHATRIAYMACFHAAQALIFERTDRAVKIHHGVHTEFRRLVKDDARADAELTTYLPRSYNFKAQADYGFAADGQPPSRDEAATALATAARFVNHCTGLLPPP
jgi:uncharacterized protein (UPF0332 family)